MTWDPGSGFIAWIRLIRFPRKLVNVIAFDTGSGEEALCEERLNTKASEAVDGKSASE